MSRLSEILGLEEEQEFEYEGNKLKVVNNKIFAVDTINGEESWVVLSNAEFLTSIIASPEKIKIIPTKPELTEQQRIAIKGRIAEGWKHIVSEDGWKYCYKEKPWIDNKKSDYFTKRLERSLANEAVFDFVEDGKCFYLPDLIGDEEDEDKNNI